MKKLLWILPILLMIISCMGVSEKAAADLASEFAANSTEEELKTVAALCSALNFPNLDGETATRAYNSPTEIDSDQLFNLFHAICEHESEIPDQFYDEESASYRVPVAYVEEMLSRYLRAFRFDPSEVSWYADRYDSKAQIFDIPSFLPLGAHFLYSWVSLRRTATMLFFL